MCSPDYAYSTSLYVYLSLLLQCLSPKKVLITFWVGVTMFQTKEQDSFQGRFLILTVLNWTNWNAENRISKHLNLKMFWEENAPWFPLQEVHTLCGWNVDYLVSYLRCSRNYSQPCYQNTYSWFLKMEIFHRRANYRMSWVLQIQSELCWCDLTEMWWRVISWTSAV